MDESGKSGCQGSGDEDRGGCSPNRIQLWVWYDTLATNRTDKASAAYVHQQRWMTATVERSEVVGIRFLAFSVLSKQHHTDAALLCELRIRTYGKDGETASMLLPTY